MTRIFNLLCVVVIFAVAVLLFDVHVARGQVCGGVTASQCRHTQYEETSFTSDNRNTCYQCTPFNPPTGYSCNINSAQYGCGACVPALSDCEQVGGIPDTLNGFPITCATDPSQINISFFKLFPNGSCGDSEDFCSTGCSTYCNQAPLTNCGACNASEPTNTCGSTSGSKTCQYNGPQACTPHGSPTAACSYNYNNCSTNFSCPGGAGYQAACVTNLTVHVYNDYNHNNAEDAEDDDFQSINVTLGGTTKATDANGNATFTGLTTGTYAISISNIPSPWTPTVGSSKNVTITTGNGNATTSFAITRLYDLSGTIYKDLDAGKCYNPTGGSGCTDKSVTPNVAHGAGKDAAYADSQTTVTVVGNGQTYTLNQANGTYDTGQVLKSGTYTVTLTTVPTDYHMTYPQNGVPAFFSNINIGSPGKSYACNTNNANDASCNGNGDMSNLDFGMNNEIAVGGGFCTDIRDEKGTQHFIPNNATCGTLSGKYYISGNSSCLTGPSIYASGAQTPDFGHGSANPNNWLIGGATVESFSPVNPGVIRTSSSYLNTTLTENAITPKDLSTVCTPSNCYLPDNLPSGVYSYPFDTTIVGTRLSATNTTVDGSYTFPTGKNYVLVVGDTSHASSLTLETKILTPNGSSATFTTSKDIYVDPAVGESDITSTAGDLEGFFSADGSFIIESGYSADNRCTDSGGTKDLRLNIIGSVIVNAGKGGGTFTNNRDLCAGDLSCPTYTTGLGDGGGNGGGNSGDTNGTQLGLTYILNAPDLIKHKNTFWQEVAP